MGRLRRPERVGILSVRVSSDTRRRHQFVKLHRLGERAAIEFLSELAVRAEAVEILDAMLVNYCRLDEQKLRAVGGDGWPTITRKVA